jgi:hypothetical protein
VDPRADAASGDYEYDLAHERTGGAPPARRPVEHLSLPPDRRRVEPDQDFSYDEAHGF